MILKSIIEKIQPSLVFFLAYFFLCLMGEGFFAAAIYAQFSSEWLPFHLAFAIVFVIAALFFMIALFTKCKSDHAQLFLIVGIPLIIGYSIFMMPFALPDEYTHINRIFDNRMSETLLVPSQLPLEYSWDHEYSKVGKWITTPFDYSNLRETEFSVSGTSWICYLIPSLIVDIGRFFNINGFLMIYITRLVNGCLFLIAGWWSIKRLPFGKLFALVFLLNPMLIQQQASVSYDCITNIGVICFSAQLLYMLHQKSNVFSITNILCLIGFIALIAISKYVYLVLTLSAFLLISKIPNRYIKIMASIASILLFIAAIFIAMNTSAYQQIALYFRAGGVNGFASSLFGTIEQYSYFHLKQFMGMNLGWPWTNDTGSATSVRVPVVWFFYTILYCAAFAFSFSKRISITAVQRIVIGCLSLLTGLITFIALWMGTTDAISWYQSRYLLPPAFFGAFALMPRIDIPLKQKMLGRIPLILSIVGMMLAFASLCAVIIKFWG